MHVVIRNATEQSVHIGVGSGNGASDVRSASPCAITTLTFALVPDWQLMIEGDPVFDEIHGLSGPLTVDIAEGVAPNVWLSEDNIPPLELC